jgi:hypothetical protein
MSITITAAIAQDGILDLTTRPGVPQVNMANGNAVALVDLLGLDFDGDFGEAPAEDFLGRVLLAQALLDVTVDDEHGRPDVRDGNWITCGRRPGYLAERLAQLHEIATWAHEHDAVVAWS